MLIFIGEKLRDWQGTDAMALCEDLTHFLDNHPHPNPDIIIDDNDDDNSNVVNAAGSAGQPMEEEDDDLKAAIAASLQDQPQNIDDDMEPESIDNWQDYLGEETEKKVEIVIRYPDGARENVSFPTGSKFKVSSTFLINFFI